MIQEAPKRNAEFPFLMEEARQRRAMRHPEPDKHRFKVVDEAGERVRKLFFWRPFSL
jgi:hypothetical protein